MTDAQRKTLMAELWPAAAAALGCSRNDRDRRIEVFSEGLGRRIESGSEIGKMEDYTKLKAHLVALAQPSNFNAVHRQTMMPRTNLLVRIGQFDGGLVRHLLKQRFTFAVWLRRNYPALEGATISQGTRAKPARKPAPLSVIQEYRDAARAAPALDDLNDKELEQLRNTLAREASHKPKAAEPVLAGADEDPDWNV